MSEFFRKRPLEDLPTAVKQLRVEAEEAEEALEVCQVVQEDEVDEEDDEDDELSDVEETQTGDSERAPSPPLLPDVPQLPELPEPPGPPQPPSIPEQRAAATPWDKSTAVKGGFYTHTNGHVGKACKHAKDGLKLYPVCTDASCGTFTPGKWGAQCKIHANPLTALILAAKPNPTALPPWKAKIGGRDHTWKGQVDKLYHHPVYNCLAIGIKAGVDGVICKRICKWKGCVSKTGTMTTPLCPIHDEDKCAENGCNNSRHGGGDFCQTHSIKPEHKCSTEGCKERKLIETGKCATCNKKDRRAANYDADYKRLILDTDFCTQTGSVPLPNGGIPKLADLSRGVKYAMLTDLPNRKVVVKVLCGHTMTLACHHTRCKQFAQSNEDGKVFFCTQHGGGKRCIAICGVDDAGNPLCPNTSKYRISDQARLAQATGPPVPRPDLVGQWACKSCLTRVDPSNEAVKLKVRIEDVVMAAFNEKLLEMDRSELTPEELATTTYDCVDGPSKRRADRLKKEAGYHLQIEPDEHQHADRLAGCERAKLSGHLIDAGAAHFTDDEAVLWEGKPGEPKPPGDDALDAMIKAEGKDSLWARKLQYARARAVRRVERDSRTNERNLHKEGKVLPKRLVIRFNTHEFTAACGTKVGPLVRPVNSTLKVTNKPKGHEDNKHETIVSLVPTGRMDAAITTLVEVYLDHLLKARTDPTWLAEQPDLKCIYLRYSGCDLDGVDREGTVAAVYAAAPANMTIAQAGADLGVKSYDPKAIYSKNKRPLPASQAGSSRDGA